MLSALARVLVTRRLIIIAVMSALTVLCGFLIPKVGVITDMAEFLPASSSMRQGLSLMEEEFPESSTPSTTRIMFTGLSDSEEEEILAELESLPHVSAVDYEADSDIYHSGDHTLYIVTTPYDYGSAEESALLAALETDFADRGIQIQSDNPSPASELPAWIVIVAVSLLTLILFIMCASWLEPLLFLITIGMAVVLNLGTNLIRGSIADITFTIGAILQLVLSMDYSIILMNRYRHERLTEPDPRAAMVTAVRGAFSSIASSSMTTVVGLLTLCFMSITIGLDLGVALAKGVFISMVCVFTILPTLIIWCDRAIRATAKPYLQPRLGALARFGHRMRWPILVLFIALFAASAVTAADTPVAYTLSKEDPIADVFPTQNQIVLVYRNSDEAAAARIAADVAEEDFVRSVSSHSETIGKQRTIEDMEAALAQMNEGGLALDRDFLELVYFLAHGGEATPTMTLAQFVDFIGSSEAVSSRLDPAMTSRIDGMRPFLDKDRMAKVASPADLARLLRMTEDEVERILLLRAISDPSIAADSMTLPDFVSFILTDVANDPQYAAELGRKAVAQLRQVEVFTDANEMTTPMGYSRMSRLLGVEEPTMRLLYAQMIAESGAHDSVQMPLPAFVETISTVIQSTPGVGSAMSADQIAGLERLRTFTDPAVITRPMDVSGLAQLFGIDPELLSALFATNSQSQGETPPSQGQNPPSMEMSPLNFAALVVSSASDPSSPVAQMMEREQIEQLTTLARVMQLSTSGTPIPVKQFAQIVGIEARQVALILAIADSETVGVDWAFTPQQVVAALEENTDLLDADQAEDLARLFTIINDSIAGRAYTPARLASFTGMSDSQARQLALVHTQRYGDTSSWNMTPQDFVAFLVDSVLTNGRSSTQFTPDQETRLRALRTLIDAVVTDAEFTPSALSSLFSRLGESVGTDKLALAYLAHAASGQSASTLSIAQLVSTLQSKIVPDPRFAPFLTTDATSAIAAADSQIDSASAQLIGDTWSRMIITTTLDEDGDQTLAFIDSLDERCRAELEGGCHLVGNSVMIAEMSKSFSTQMSLISWLTAGAIFLVIALTFWSLSVPLLLVLLVQCGVFITITAIGLQGYDSYYLAQLMVQCILMGATIDYGILLTTQYRDARLSLDIPGALARALDRSIHTIATSGSIMIVVTGILGHLFENPTVGQICRTISIGAIAATFLIVFILPGLLAAGDRFVAGRGEISRMRSILRPE